MARGPRNGSSVLAADGGVLDPHGPVAAAAEDLWWLMLVLGVAAFLVFALLLGRGLWRSHGDEEVVDEDRLVRRWIVAGGVVLPAVLIAVVFGATLAAMRHTPSTPPTDSLEIEIVGHQFWYEVRYPDAGVVTANELHVPLGRPVAFRLRSEDVIHSFWVPALGGKMDLIPERENTLVLQADEPGEHVSRCAEFCGLQHALMKLVVVAEPAEDFDGWLHDLRSAADASGDTRAAGREVFVSAGCVDCHAVPGSGGTSPDAPDLTALAARRTIGAGVLDNTRRNARDWIRDPQAIKRGVDMPAASLGDGDLDALLDYLGYAR